MSHNNNPSNFPVSSSSSSSSLQFNQPQQADTNAATTSNRTPSQPVSIYRPRHTYPRPTTFNPSFLINDPTPFLPPSTDPRSLSPTLPTTRPPPPPLPIQQPAQLQQPTTMSQPMLNLSTKAMEEIAQQHKNNPIFTNNSSTRPPPIQQPARIQPRQLPRLPWQQSAQRQQPPQPPSHPTVTIASSGNTNPFFYNYYNNATQRSYMPPPSYPYPQPRFKNPSFFPRFQPRKNHPNLPYSSSLNINQQSRTIKKTKQLLPPAPPRPTQQPQRPPRVGGSSSSTIPASRPFIPQDWLRLGNNNDNEALSLSQNWLSLSRGITNNEARNSSARDGAADGDGDENPSPPPSPPPPPR